MTAALELPDGLAERARLSSRVPAPRLTDLTLLRSPKDDELIELMKDAVG